jgi:hypothetical protein
MSFTSGHRGPGPLFHPKHDYAMKKLPELARRELCLLQSKSASVSDHE